MLNEVDRVHLRSLERDMHLCASKCCESQTATIDDVQDCVRECQTPAIKAGKFVQVGTLSKQKSSMFTSNISFQDEVERFHGFLSRCILQCQDDIKDKVIISSLISLPNVDFDLQTDGNVQIK